MEDTTSHSSQFAGGHHARMFDGRTPMHIISRVYQWRFLLRPNDELNDLILGVVGRGQVVYPKVKLHMSTVMSNHLHAIATGPPTQLPFFIGFIKREISRRWGMRPDVDWPGAMWEPYVATALPTHESQVNALKYVLSQGVKEDLVERPQDWPGVNWFHALLLGRKMSMVSTCLPTTAKCLWLVRCPCATTNQTERLKTTHIVESTAWSPLSPLAAASPWLSRTTSRRRSETISSLISGSIEREPAMANQDHGQDARAQ
jgi:REP element-mobilizing transposase RayT